jgi:hypothetical protein
MWMEGMKQVMRDKAEVYDKIVNILKIGHMQGSTNDDMLCDIDIIVKELQAELNPPKKRRK